MTSPLHFIQPNWQAPANVHALCTTRLGGLSQEPFAGLNLGMHVGDDPQLVLANRAMLQQEAHLPEQPLYLNQTHSTDILTLPFTGGEPNADGAYTTQANTVCVVMTADCLPVLLCNQGGTEVCAVHAGWRGLCNGILENAVSKFSSLPEQIMAWLAPAINQEAFQVGNEVQEAFMTKDPKAQIAFLPDPKTPNKYLANIYQLARQRLNAVGVQEIFGGNYCTFTQIDLFYSYRRACQTDNGKTGRIASLIWFS